eukprot:3853237-Pyramimonas_sp.AAC.1
MSVLSIVAREGRGSRISAKHINARWRGGEFQRHLPRRARAKPLGAARTAAAAGWARCPRIPTSPY